MNFNLVLPICPICKASLTSFEVTPGPRQMIRFRCAATWKRTASRDFKDPEALAPYGDWSVWSNIVQCTKATDITLALLAEKKA